MPEHVSLRMSDFDYELPEELIAQTPVEPRDSSRLLVVERTTGKLTHRHFRDIGEFLRPGDLLIANQSRVIPARLLGRRAETGGAVEVLLLSERPDLGLDTWEALVRPGRRLRERALLLFGEESGSGPLLEGEILERTEAGGRVLRLSLPRATGATEGSEAQMPYLPGVSVRERIERLGACRCRRIFTRRWPTRNATRRSMRASAARLRLPRRVCTLRRSCWIHCGSRGYAWAL